MKSRADIDVPGANRLTIDEDRIRLAASWTTILIIVYLFWFFTTPYYSHRLSFLATIKFEKFLAGSLIIATFFYGRVSNLLSTISLMLITVLVLMTISSYVSSYGDYSMSLHWRETYWKKVVFFAVVAAGVRRLNDIHTIFKWIVYIVLFYQLYSWFDYVRGGSYVYQQGMKRMIGTWSGGGLGSANGFGLLSAFALPFVVYYYRTAISTHGQRLAILAGIISIASIVYSGTRGALLVALVYIGIEFRKKLLRPKYFLAGLFSLPFLVYALPEDITHRYWDLLVSIGSTEDQSKTDAIAIKSGMGRIEGMINGFKLGMRRPILGYGPGTSAIAVNEVKTEGTERLAQLHNLYGQMAAEIGLLGSLLWLSLVGVIISSLHKINSSQSPGSHLSKLVAAINGGFTILLLYGMCAHSLYNVYFLLLFGLAVALNSVAIETQNENNEEDSLHFEISEP